MASGNINNSGTLTSLYSSDTKKRRLFTFTGGGNALANQMVNLGSIAAYCPSGYSIEAVFLSPIANVPLIMSAVYNEIYVYSLSFSGQFTYNALVQCVESSS